MTLALLGMALAFGVPAPIALAQQPGEAAPILPPALTAQQRKLAKVRHDQIQRQINALRTNTKLSPEEKQVRLRGLVQGYSAYLISIMTPTQRAYVETQRKRQQTMAQQQQAFYKAHQAEISQYQALMAKFNQSLTPTQQAQSNAIGREAVSEARKIMASTKLSPEAKRAKVAAVQSAGRAKSLAILTPAQRADFDRLDTMQKNLRLAAGKEGLPVQ